MTRVRKIIVGVAGLIVLITTSLLLWDPAGEDERYAVYSAYIDAGLTGESHSFGDPQGTVLIQTHTSDDATIAQRWASLFLCPSALEWKEGAPSRFLVCRFFARNLWVVQFWRNFKIKARYELLGGPNESLLDASDNFPDSYGVLSFSAVTFSWDGRTAFFYAEHRCGLCGGAEYVEMRKDGGSWMIANTHTTWVS